MSTDSQKLRGKVAIVTGASKGIGAAIASHLGHAGASVVVNYSSSKEGADRVVADITSQGGKAIAVQANVSQKPDIDRLFADTITAFGRVDVLVNNAGMFDFTPLAEVTEEHFHRQVTLNVLGLLLVSQKAAETFGGGGGSIINISSVAAVRPQPRGARFPPPQTAGGAPTPFLPEKTRAPPVPGGSPE